MEIFNVRRNKTRTVMIPSWTFSENVDRFAPYAVFYYLSNVLYEQQVSTTEESDVNDEIREFLHGLPCYAGFNNNNIILKITNNKSSPRCFSFDQAGACEFFTPTKQYNLFTKLKELWQKFRTHKSEAALT